MGRVRAQEPRGAEALGWGGVLWGGTDSGPQAPVSWPRPPGKEVIRTQARDWVQWLQKRVQGRTGAPDRRSRTAAREGHPGAAWGGDWDRGLGEGAWGRGPGEGAGGGGWDRGLGEGARTGGGGGGRAGAQEATPRAQRTCVSEGGTGPGEYAGGLGRGHSRDERLKLQTQDWLQGLRRNPASERA